MKTVINFNGQTFTEASNINPVMTNNVCNCGNPMYVPLAVLVLGIVEDCAHCNKEYPFEAHCNAITQAYQELIEDGGSINLD